VVVCAARLSNKHIQQVMKSKTHGACVPTRPMPHGLDSRDDGAVATPNPAPQLPPPGPPGALPVHRILVPTSSSRLAGVQERFLLLLLVGIEPSPACTRHAHR